MVVVDAPQSVERRIYAPFIPHRGVVLLGSNGCFKTDCLVDLLAETCIHVPYPLIDVNAAGRIGQNVSRFIEGVLIALVARKLSFHAIRQPPPAPMNGFDPP